MRTRTIYNAFRETYRRALLSNAEFRIRQWQTFERELLRRMDERDALVALRQAFLTPERIGQYMAGLSDSMKADDILRGGK